jgi:hypothetical protein
MTLKSTKTSEKAVLKTTPQVNTKRVSIPTKINANNRHDQIAKEAYYLAENAHFKGDSVAHWLQAEASIDAKLATK